jgi:glycerol-3-phosphate dehydrogenase
LPPVDILVIGGGVNGLAVAREASSRGWQAAVVDAEDFGAGTSGTSSRLIHGGIRYLENLEFHLVRESLRERERLLQTAPHLVKPFPLLIPFYRHNRRSGFIMRLGMFLYDVLSFDKSTPLHKPLSKVEVELMYPGLESGDLYGAVLYYDAQVANAERLCVEQALDVASFGGRIHNHLKVTGLSESEEGGVSVQLTDTLTNRKLVQPAGVVVNASGPWVDMVLSGSTEQAARLIGGTKGSHMTVGPFPGAPKTGVHYEAVSDGRAILVLPLPDGNYLIGSTDIFFEGDPADAVMSDEEIAYLLEEVNTLIPGAGLDARSVLHTVAGVRPLPYSPDARSAAQVSRNHHVSSHPTITNLFSISGGKLTTHRALGELAMNVVEKHAKPRAPRGSFRIFRSGKGWTRHLKLPGARCADWGQFQKDFLDRTSLPLPTAHRLLGLYGVRAARIESLICADPSLAAPLPSHRDAVGAEVVLAVREEFARTLIDVVARRMLLSWCDDAGLKAIDAVAEIAARELQWDDQRVRQELEAYRQWIRLRRPRVLEDTAIMLSNLAKYPTSTKKSEQ